VVYILEYLGKVAKVHSFSKTLAAIENDPIVKVALAYDDPNCDNCDYASTSLWR
jgi:hypothetical protein